MRKFKNAALAALVTAGLAGSAATVLVPPVAHAQGYNDNNNNNHGRDRDYSRAHRGAYYRYRHESAYHRDWLGIGTPGYGFGFYTNRYHHYCSHWDPTYGYCYF